MKILNFYKVSSTNDLALRMANMLPGEALLITAQKQTCGRGRLNQRVWLSDPSNFQGTFLIKFSACPNDNNCCFLNDLLLEKIVAMLKRISNKNGDKISVKKPNDILIDGKKCMGLLIEIAMPYVAIGIGLNLKTSPIETSTNIFDALGVDIDTSAVSKMLFEEIEKIFEVQ